ncbi:hypothetical protein ILYODFUR_037434, partial [Ilyodon furcidens]
GNLNHQRNIEQLQHKEKTLKKEKRDLESQKGQSQKMNSSVTAVVGEDVVLPCHLEPPKDASQMTVKWIRPDLNSSLVYVSVDGHEYPDDQNEAYKGRTTMSLDKMKSGDISLKLSDVRLSDNGRYRCYIPNVEKEYFVNLIVGKWRK